MPIWSLLAVLCAVSLAASPDSNRALAGMQIDYVYGGTNWGAYCNSGLRQSPLDFRTVTASFLDDYFFSELTASYKSFSPVYGFTATTYRVEGSFGQFTLQTVDSGVLEQFDGESVVFHAPSEHAIAGHHFALEMQLRHHYNPINSDRPSNSSYAVLSFFFELGSENDLLSAVIANAETLDFSSLLAGGVSDYFLYDGSDTAFPCEENVRYAVVAKPLQLSSDQLTFFRSKWADNLAFARGNGNNKAVVENIGGRTIYRILWRREASQDILPMPSPQFIWASQYASGFILTLGLGLLSI